MAVDVDQLSAYLRTEASRPFGLGTADCGLFIADWVRERIGVDPMAYCRGGYADERGVGDVSTAQSSDERRPVEVRNARNSLSTVRLADYLRRQAALPFALGKTDCCLFIANWAMEQRGVDPMAYCRGGYATWTEADALRSGWGGLVRVAGRAARQAGLRMTREPRVGDVAVVMAGDVTACAIRGRRSWAVRLDVGGLAMLSIDRVRVIAAWRI